MGSDHGSNLAVQAYSLAEQPVGGNTWHSAPLHQGLPLHVAPLRICLFARCGALCAMVPHLPAIWAARCWGAVAASFAVVKC